MHQLSKIIAVPCKPPAVSQEEVENAVRTILFWIGDDPPREGLGETPARVVRAFKSYFSGYEQQPEEFLKKTFDETAGYDEMVLLRKIPLASHLCISGRGVKKHGVDLTTTKMLGCFRQEASRRQEFLAMANADGPD